VKKIYQLVFFNKLDIRIIVVLYKKQDFGQIKVTGAAPSPEPALPEPGKRSIFPVSVGVTANDAQGNNLCK
jgi:hypothetical protein